jgi:uncharacterized protein YbjT (DUF2867 family)
VTRNAHSEKAQALTAMGAEVVAGDVGDAESLRRAFDGAWGVYCVTFFRDHFSPDRERQEAANMADAAKAAGVERVIWSTLEDTRRFLPLESDQMPTLQGKYKVPHFDVKGEMDAYFLEKSAPTTCLLTSFYWDNFIHFGMAPQRGADGQLAITFPMGDKPLPGIAAEDIGKCAFGVFQRPELIGRTVGIAGEHLTGAQMASAFSRVLGEEVRYNDVPPEVYRSFGFPGADDLGNMFQFKRDFNDEFRAPRDVEASRALNPELLSFDAWLQANAAKLPRG